MGSEELGDTERLIELCELGPLGIRSDGRWHAVRGVRTRAALAMLSLCDIQGARTEALIEAIWPSPDQPPSARQSLANLVARLRSTHGERFIETTGDGYRFGTNVVSDRTQFLLEVSEANHLVGLAPNDALRVADAGLARVRGRPWHDVEQPDGVAADRAHLQANVAAAHRVRASALLALDRAAEAIPVLESLVDDHPTDESMWLDLASAFAALGHRVEALRTLRRARKELAAYGLTINELSAELERRLLQGASEVADVGAEFPHAPTPLLGRDGLLDDVDALLGSNRLVTLVGPGGVGKTRLAVALAERNNNGNDQFFVDLSPIRDQRSVASAIVSALGIAVPPGTPPSDALISALDSRPTLLVLDNCEQVVSGVCDVVSSLMMACASVSVIATSREHLGTQEERVVKIEPLPTDAAGAGVELFFERAHRLGVDLPTAVWREPVAKLVEALDGLPLAIELAAGRTTVLNPIEIDAALEERFVILRDSHTGANLEEAIRWSWDLLDNVQQDAMHHLSVFRSGATFDAASRVLGLDRWATLEVVERLSRKSLVQVTHQTGRPSRIELLDTVRHFVLGEAERSGALSACRDAHLAWFDEFTIEAIGDFGNEGHEDPVGAIDVERHELRAALDHAMTNPTAAATGVRICHRCFHWWRGRSATGEGLERLKTLLPLADLDIADRVNASATLASLARIAALPDRQVEELVADAHRLLELVAPSADRDRMELRLAEAEFDDSDPTLGPRLRRLCEAGASGGDVTALHLLTAWAITNTPDDAPRIAEEFFTEALARGGPCLAHAREFQGLAAVVAAELTDAGIHMADALDLHGATGQTFCAIHCCESIAWLMVESGDIETATSLLASTQGLRHTHGRNRAGFEEQAITGALRHLGALPAPDPTADIDETIERARRAARSAAHPAMSEATQYGRSRSSLIRPTTQR